MKWILFLFVSLLAMTGCSSMPSARPTISSTSVKLVELSQNASGEYVLERFALEPVFEAVAPSRPTR